MRHARYYLIFVLVSFCAFAQNRPGVDYFPQIGFFDFMVQYLHPPHGDAASIETSVISNNYYHPKLKELGITDIVTDWAEYKNVRPSSDPATDFFIHDMGFEWRDNGIRAFTPAGFLKSFGHKRDIYTLRFGGTPVDNLSFEKNFGFSYLDGQDRSSYWCMTTDTKPIPNIIPETGDSVRDGANWVRRARVSNDDNGLLLWGRLPWLQFFFENMNYYIDIKVKKIPAGGSNPLLFKIVVCQAVENNTQPTPDGYYKKTSIVSESSDAPLANAYLEQYVYWNDITHAAGTYDWFRSNAFTINRQTTTQFYIVWYDQSDIYIDQIAMYNDKYKNSFITNTHDYFKNNVFQPLQTTYSGIIDSRFKDFYFDEPFMLTARARGKLQDTLGNMFSNRPDVQVNGATGSLPEYFLQFDNKYARESQNAPHKKYILFNMYPFGEDNMYDQTTVQNKLNDLIKCSSLGSAHAAYGYNYAGLRAAQLAAQQYDSDSLNDVPLFMTLQVQAEHQLNSSNVYVPNSQRGKRPPTRDEIFAMGHLSLAFGVKGFMYYMIPTRCEIWGDGTHWGTYGLFDEAGNPYDYVDKIGLWQNPEAAQVKNERFDAVKDFIASFKQYENTLLKLRWLDAKYWNDLTANPKSWINNLETSPIDSFPVNPSDPAMVQTGYFEEYSNFSGYNENAKYIYFVNRRCNPPESNNSDRYIRFKIDSTVASNYSNVKVTNMKTGQTFFTSKNSLFTLFLNAGDGTLLKFEPTILAGGLLVENETVSTSIEVDSSLELSQYKKLRIENGADLTFKNSSRLYVYNSDLEIEGTPSNPSVINFLSPNWTLGNGLVARYADVSINNARIKNASAGIYGYRCSTFVVSNTIIDSCYFGIAMEEQGSPYGTNVLSNLTLNRCNTRGITTNDVILMANDVVISDGENAMMFWDSEFNCLLGQDTANINILNHTTGVYSNNSDLNFGYEDGGSVIDGAYNTFLSADNFYVENYSEVMAQYDYWESKSNYCDYTSTLVDEPSFKYEGDNPLIIPNDELASVKHNFTGEGGSTVEKFELAKRMYKKGHLRQARDICSDIIDNNSNDKLIPAVISLLIRTFKEEGKEALGQYIANGNNATSNSTAKGLLQAATALFTEDVNTVYDDIITRYPGKYPAEYSLYKKALYQTGSQMDKKGAKITFNKLRTDFPNSLFIKDLVVRLADTMGFSNKSVTPLGLPKQQTQTSNTEVFEYQLLNNYPNPFNPETVIKFSLKEKSNVTLDVYNIAGQKVAELVSGEMEKGFYERKFDGTKLSSGVYIFRLSAQSLENGNLKYSKTMKALLLK